VLVLGVSDADGAVILLSTERDLASPAPKPSGSELLAIAGGWSLALQLCELWRRHAWDRWWRRSGA
jgi:hypothetical protein